MHEVAYHNAYYTNSKKPGSLRLLLIMEHERQKNSTLTQSDHCKGTVMLDYTVSVKERKLKNRKTIVFLGKYIYIHKDTQREEPQR